MDSYVQAFERFEAATDEKEVLARELISKIRSLKAQSLLDIGAGSGQLASRLAEAVSEYVAVEQRPRYAEQLAGLGLTTVLGQWPMTLSRKFDIVLMSHVLSPGEPILQMLKSALNHLRPLAELIVVLHDLEGSDWAELLTHVMINYDDEVAVPNTVLAVLADFGATVEIRHITTHLYATDINTMLNALSFVASSGEPHRQKAFFAERDRIVARLTASYQRDTGGYAFPFQHLLVSATMPS